MTSRDPFGSPLSTLARKSLEHIALRKTLRSIEVQLPSRILSLLEHSASASGCSNEEVVVAAIEAYFSDDKPVESRVANEISTQEVLGRQLDDVIDEIKLIIARVDVSASDETVTANMGTMADKLAAYQARLKRVMKSVPKLLVLDVELLDVLIARKQLDRLFDWGGAVLVTDLVLSRIRQRLREREGSGKRRSYARSWFLRNRWRVTIIRTGYGQRQARLMALWKTIGEPEDFRGVWNPDARPDLSYYIEDLTLVLTVANVIAVTDDQIERETLEAAAGDVTIIGTAACLRWIERQANDPPQ